MVRKQRSMSTSSEPEPPAGGQPHSTQGSDAQSEHSERTGSESSTPGVPEVARSTQSPQNLEITEETTYQPSPSAVEERSSHRTSVLTPPSEHPKGIAKHLTQLELIVHQAPQNAFAIIVAQVDPDAIGAAAGMAALIRSRLKEAKITIYYAGLVAHAQNRVVMDMLHDLQVERIDIFRNDGTEVVVLVDSCQINDSRLPERLRGNFRPQIIIDHHHNAEKLEPTDEELFIIESVGACCTLVTELIVSIEGLLQRISHRTLLFIGINNDTGELSRSDDRDRQAYVKLSPFIDQAQFTRFKDFAFSPSYYVHLEQALKNRVLNNNRLVTGVGDVDADNGDDLSSIADHLFRMEKIALVLVWGIVQGKVRITARAKNTARLEKLLADNFGSEGGAKTSPSGISQGGATLKLNLPKWLSPKRGHAKEAFVTFIHERIQEIVFHVESDEDFA